MSKFIKLALDCASDVGHRKSNEDRWLMIPDLKLSTSPPDSCCQRTLLAVFDGHGGLHAAEFLHKNMVPYFTQESQYGIDTKQALRSSIMKLDAAFLHFAQHHGRIYDGSTAIVVVIETDAVKKSIQVITANVGDSRAILISKSWNKVKPLSWDQTPNRKDEYSRVYENGGFVAYTNVYEPPKTMWLLQVIQYFRSKWASRKKTLRVYPGGLGCSRSIGDLDCKATGAIIADPEISIHEIEPGNSLSIVVASDGLWGFTQNKSVAATIKKQLNNIGQENLCQELISLAKRNGSLDNITVITATFLWRK